MYTACCLEKWAYNREHKRGNLCKLTFFARWGGNYIIGLKGFGIRYEWIRTTSGKICVTLNQLSTHIMVTQIIFYLSVYSFSKTNRFQLNVKSYFKCHFKLIRFISIHWFLSKYIQIFDFDPNIWLEIFMRICLH